MQEVNCSNPTQTTSQEVAGVFKNNFPLCLVAQHNNAIMKGLYAGSIANCSYPDPCTYHTLRRPGCSSFAWV